jgi:hypothetical protein
VGHVFVPRGLIPAQSMLFKLERFKLQRTLHNYFALVPVVLQGLEFGRVPVTTSRAQEVKQRRYLSSRSGRVPLPDHTKL